MYTCTTKMLVLLFLFICFPILSTSQSTSIGATFNYTNSGDFVYTVDGNWAEYDASFRVTNIFTNPFQIFFYNTTPNNEYTLAIRMGTRRSRSVSKWVWEANRGNPVGDNATFTLGKDGNMVLAHADGRIAWQTNTAGKGVVGFELLSNGNFVLRDKRNNYVWQSFDYPTDTLLVGQSLRASGGPKTLVSRVSEKVNANGLHSMVLEPRGLSLYYKTKNSPRPYLYYWYADWFSVQDGAISYVSLNTSSEELYSYGYDLVYQFQIVNSTNPTTEPVDRLLARPKYNTTLTHLRLGIDGNVRLRTYFPKIVIFSGDSNNFDAWEDTYTLFAETGGEDECLLPQKCGNFGLCEKSQCVACPTPTGLTGWSLSCQAPKLSSSCAANSFTYYKLEGVDHIASRYTKGEGPMKENECMGKCSKNCKCVAYFYHQLTSRCWAVNDLMTLTKVANSTHVGYIKTPVR